MEYPVIVIAAAMCGVIVSTCNPVYTEGISLVVSILCLSVYPLENYKTKIFPEFS